MGAAGRRRALPAGALLLLCLMLGGTAASAEVLYLSPVTVMETAPVLNDLLSRELDDSSLGRTPLSIDLQEGAVFLRPGGLSLLLNNRDLSVVGAGVWIIPAMQDSEVETLHKKIVTIEVPTASTPYGYRLSRERLADLMSADAEVNPTSRSYRAAGISPLTREDLVTAADPGVRVPAGSTVSILIARHGFTVRADGRTNRSARVGDSVPVTLGATRQRLNARLTGTSEAEVDL